MKKKAAIIGAGGVIGAEVTQQLIKRGYLIKGIYVDNSPQLHNGVIPVQLDETNPGKLFSVLKDVSTIVYLLWRNPVTGTITPKGKTDRKELKDFNELYHTPNVRLVKWLIDEAPRIGFSKLVFLSSVNAAPQSDSEFLREKYLAEHIILNSSIQKKVILRVPIVVQDYVHYDPFFKTIARLFKFPLICPIPVKNFLINGLHANDVARMVCEFCDHPQAERGVIIETANGQKMPLEQIFEMVEKRILGKRKIHVRGALGRWLTLLIEQFSHSSGLETPSIFDFLKLNTNPDPRKTLKMEPLRAIENNFKPLDTML